MAAPEIDLDQYSVKLAFGRSRRIVALGNLSQ